MQSNQEIKAILNRINQGQELPDDRRLLQQWYDQSPDTETTLPEGLNQQGLKDQIWAGISDQLPATGKSRRWIYAAAAALLLFGLTGLLLNRKIQKESQTLQLHAGLHIIGPEQQVETIERPLSAFLDTAAYLEVKSQQASDTPTQVFTDKGQFGKIQLPDGTKVTLNTDTRLTLSPDFETSDTRIVHLEGEAFFEVTSLPRRSFIVKTKTQEIHVLGTKFNVKAYPDQKQVITSLLEGKIKLLAHGQTQILKPRQQAINPIGAGKVQIQTQDPGKVTGWKQLSFQFNQEPIEQVLRQLGRWYNLKLVFQTPAPDQLISGKIDHGASLEDLQLILGNLTHAEYHLEDQVLYVNFKQTQQP